MEKIDRTLYLVKVLDLIRPHLKEFDWGHSLVVAWCLLRGYEEHTGEFSKQHCVNDLRIESDALLSKLLDFANDCHEGASSENSASRLALLLHIADEPFSLVHALDWMAMHGQARTDGFGRINYAAQSGFGGPYQLTDEEFKGLLSTPKDPNRRYWLIRNRVASPTGYAEVSVHHAHYFLRHWRIAEMLLDGSYKIEVKSTHQIGLDWRLTGSPPVNFKIMTANFPAIECNSVAVKWGNDGVAGYTAGLVNLDDVRAWVLTYLKLAITEKVSVLVMPELTIPPEVHELISDELRAFPASDSPLQMVITGSCHVEKDVGSLNSVRISAHRGSRFRLIMDTLSP
jgi:hypothetical protein